jgi:hypothetical protein
MVYRKILLILVLFVLLVVIIAAFFMTDRQLGRAQSNQESSDFGRKLTNIIGYLNQQISNRSSSDPSRKGLEYRKKYYEWLATWVAEPTVDPKLMIAEQQTLAAVATQTFLVTTPLPTSYRPVGILRDPGYVRFIEQEAHLADDFWIGKSGETYIVVYTGYLRSEPDQGVIYIYPENIGKWIKILTPDKSGLYKITSYRDCRLVLDSTGGKTIYFDVLALQFASSMDEVLPTATPFLKNEATPYPEP